MPDAPPSRLRRLAFRLAALALGLAGAVGVAEVALRVVAPQPVGPSHLTPDPEVGVIPKPGLSGTVRLPGLYTYAFGHDAEGFRLTPPSREGAPLEVLILGDSFAYGMGVQDGETTASRLAEALDERGMDVRVTNAARIGAGPGYALRLLQTRGEDWRPDVVVYLFCYNDYANVQYGTYFDVAEDQTLTPVAPRDSLRQLKARFSDLPGVRAMQAHSHVAGLVRRLGVGLVGDDVAPPSLTDLDTLNAPVAYSEPYRRWLVDAYLGALHASSTARGAAFQAFYIPSAAEVASLRRTHQPTVDERAFREILAERGIDGTALTPALAEAERPIADLYYPEIHWRPSGHEVAASVLVDPVQAALCAQDLSRRGCAEAPEAVRRIAETRARLGSGG